MQAVKICSYRTGRRAAMWLWDPAVLFATAPAFALALYGLSLWPALGVMVATSCWFAQVSLTANRPGSVRLSRSFLFIPFHWRSGSVASLTTVHDDEYGGGADDPKVGVAVDGWELLCYRPDQVGDWIRDSAPGRDVPKASVVERQDRTPRG